MYMIVEGEDIIRIPPHRLGEDYDKLIEEFSYEKLEGTVKSLDEKEIKDPQERKYFIVALLNIMKDGEGRIIPGDGGVYQKVKFKALAQHFELQEVIEGFVEDVKEIGIFVKFDVLTGLLHISQILDDRFDYDDGNKKLIGKDTRKEFRINDKLRVRIVSISINDYNLKSSKIGLTMRQPGLGKMEDLMKNEKS
ncbi:MAG: DNA-directed RNA polymerase [Thermoplasmata archaeon]